MTGTVLFIPSNGNHVNLFYPIYQILKQRWKTLFLTQGKYKNEGAKEALSALQIEFKQLDKYEKQNPHFVLQTENVQAVIICNDTDVIPQWFVNVANKNGIPTILIQDGALFEYKKLPQKLSHFMSTKSSNFKLKQLAARLLLSKQYRSITYGLANCTQIHVWGNSSMDYLTKKGIDKKTVSIVGNPRSAAIRTNTHQKQPKKTILYVPSDLVFSDVLKKDEFKKLTHMVCSAVESLDTDIKLIIKPHPKEDSTIYEDFKNLATISNDNTYELLRQADLTVTDLSSVSLESIAANVPVVIFLPQLYDVAVGGSFPIDLIEKKVALFSRTQKELTQNMKKILDNNYLMTEDSISNILHEYLGPMDGNEALRSANLIMTLLDGNDSKSIK